MLLGLVGKKQSGKDYALKMLREHLKGKIEVVRIAFADPLKEEISKITEMSLEQIEDNKSWMRPLLQWWGTDFRRRYNPDYWIEKYLYKVKQTEASNEKEVLIVTPDIRFINEAQLVRKLGGKVWKINREYNKDNWSSNNDCIRSDSMPVLDTTTHHPSETEMDLIASDVIIFNNGVAVFDREVKHAFDKYLTPKLKK
jgi:hypothetical protein